MKIKIAQAFELEMLYAQLRDKQMPIKTAYKLSKLVKGLEADTEFYRDKLQKILAEYAEKDANGQFILNDEQTSIKIKPDKAEECGKAMLDLQEMEIDVDLTSPFELEELDKLELTLSEFNALVPFIKE